MLFNFQLDIGTALAILFPHAVGTASQALRAKEQF